MKLEDLDEWKIAALIEGEIEKSKYKIMKLVAVARAAKKLIEICSLICDEEIELQLALRELEKE